MKVTVHLKNSRRFLHTDVGVEIDCEVAPRLGELIYMTVEDEDKLFDSLREWTDKNVEKHGKDYPDIYADWWDDEEATYTRVGGLKVVRVVHYPKLDAEGFVIPGEYGYRVEVIDDDWKKEPQKYNLRIEAVKVTEML